MYFPLALLGGAVLFSLSKGVGFFEAIDFSLGILLASKLFFWLLICPFAWIYYLYDRRKKSSPEQTAQKQATILAPLPTTSEPYTKFYEQAFAELDSDERDSGIWAKAYAEADNEEGTRKLYVKGRAAQLMSKQKISTASEASVEKEVPHALSKPRYYSFKIYVAVIALILFVIFLGFQRIIIKNRPSKFLYDDAREIYSHQEIVDFFIETFSERQLEYALQNPRNTDFKNTPHYRAIYDALREKSGN